MNDNDIIEIMKVCSMASGCKSCRFADSTDCAGEVSAFALDLINRQKAEIEKLKRDVDEARCEYTGLQIDKDEMFNESVALIKNAGIKAIKEFAEKLKGRTTKALVFGHEYNITTTFGIDALVKEMTEEHNGNV